jgi:hypothetical protein
MVFGNGSNYDVSSWSAQVAPVMLESKGLNVGHLTTDVAVSTGTAAATVSILHIWHANTSGSNRDILRIRVFVTGGVAASATLVTLGVKRTTANNSGGTNPVPMSWSPAYSLGTTGMTYTAGGTAPTRAGSAGFGAVYTIGTTLGDTQDFLLYDHSMMGEVLRLRSGQSEGLDIYAVVSGALTTAGSVFAEVHYAET